jgi:hypothetical protein
MTHQDAEEFGHAPNEPHDPQGKPTMKDKINPDYYRKGIETTDYIQSHSMNYLEGNIIKYVTRYKDKGGVLDLKKAEWYLTRLIKQEEQANG